jgi:hypothetical protein
VEPTHKLYIDDSGNRDYSPDRDYNSSSGRTPVFVYAGVLARNEVAVQLASSLASLKVRRFGRADVELKGNWLSRERSRRERYLEPFSLTEAELTAFVDEVYGLLLSADCQLIGAVVDKRKVQEKYPEPWHPSTIAYEVLAQRVQREMEEVDGSVHFTVDDVAGATPAGREFRALLERHQKQLQTRGSSLQVGMVMDRLRGMAFADSKTEQRVQLADLVAFASFKQALKCPEPWDSPLDDSSAWYKYFARLLPKFRQKNGRVAGFGFVLFP